MEQGKQLDWEYIILGPMEGYRDVSSGNMLSPPKSCLFPRDLPDRKKVEEIRLLKVTKIQNLETFSLEERLHNKLLPDRRQTKEIITLG